MSRGPFGFPRITDRGPLVDSLEPHIDVESGLYSMGELEELQDKTARDTKTFMDRVLDVSDPDDAVFRYGKYYINNIAVSGGFIPTLSRYVLDSPTAVRGMHRSDLSSLSGSFPHHASREEAEDKVRRDIERVNDIYSEMEDEGGYWPPTFDPESSTLDGAHRVAALYHFTGLQNKIYAWRLENPDEIGVARHR